MLFEAVAVLLLIVLVFVLYVMVTSGGSSSSSGYILSGVISNPGSSGYSDNMFIGDKGMLYTVDGKNVNAIGRNSSIVWSFAIPDLLNNTEIESWVGQKAATDNGTLYIELAPVNDALVPNVTELLSISSQGKLLWAKPFAPNSFFAYDGSLYLVFRNFPTYLAVYDANGTEVWRATDVWSIPAFGENGNVYMLKGMTGYELDACTQDGVSLWQINTSEYNMGNTWSYNQENIFYYNHTILLPLQLGLIALNEDGSLKWKAPYDISASLFEDQPIDNIGNIYFHEGSRIFYISPDGVETTLTNYFIQTGLNMNSGTSPSQIIDLNNKILYSYQMQYANNNNSPLVGYMGQEEIESEMSNPEAWKFNLFGNRSLNQLDTLQINAVSPVSGNELWNFNLPVSEHTVTFTELNYRSLVVFSNGIENDNKKTPSNWYSSRNITYGKTVVGNYSIVDMKTSNGILYVYFWTYNYQIPTFFGLSKCTYAGGVYAIDKNGSLLWYKPTDSTLTAMKTNNGTIYFGTNEGDIYVTTQNAAVGMALTVALYLFIRFFIVGAVARARGRIDSNKNRNTVLKFIAENPGVSLYDISKRLSINMGTVRYHLMILSINHRIISYRPDEKYIRYFTNAGSYTKEQQFIISLIRRDSIKKVLAKLLETEHY